MGYEVENGCWGLNVLWVLDRLMGLRTVDEVENSCWGFNVLWVLERLMGLRRVDD